MTPLRILFIAAYGAISLMPLAWLGLTSFKSKADSISTTAKFLPAAAGTAEGIRFKPTLDGYRRLGERYAGARHDYFHYLLNTVLIGLASTAAAVSPWARPAPTDSAASASPVPGTGCSSSSRPASCRRSPW